MPLVEPADNAAIHRIGFIHAHAYHKTARTDQRATGFVYYISEALRALVHAIQDAVLVQVNFVRRAASADAWLCFIAVSGAKIVATHGTIAVRIFIAFQQMIDEHTGNQNTGIRS